MSKKINLTIKGKIKPNLWELFHAWHKRIVKKAKKDSFSKFGNWFSELADMGYYMDDDDANYVFPYNDLDDGGDDEYEKYWKRQEAKRKQREKMTYDEMIDFYEIGKEDGKKKKHKNRGKRKRCKVININTPYSGWEDDPTIVGDSQNDSEWEDNPSKIDMDYGGMSYLDDEEEEYKKYKKTHASELDDRPRYDDVTRIWYYPDYTNRHDRLEFDSLMEFDEYCDKEGIVISKDVAEELAYRPINHVCNYLLGGSFYETASGETYIEMLENIPVYD